MLGVFLMPVALLLMLYAAFMPRIVEPEIPIFATLTVEETERGLFTPYGDTPSEAARRLGAGGAEVVDYRHSGWVTGDDSSVVAYAGVTIA